MVDDLYDAISMVWSWRRPTSEGKATAVAIEPIGHSRGRDTLPLAIAYRSSFGDDRPYRGESFREPAFFAKKRMVAARHKFHIHQQVTVRYRRGAPV